MVKETVAAVVFDWAGTVVDFGSRAPVGAFVELFARHGVTISDREARAPMGLPKREHILAIGRMAGVADRWLTRHGEPFGDSHADRLYAEYGPMNAEAATRHADLVPGTAQTVRWLRARGLAVGSNTGYSREIMRDLLPLAARQGFDPDCLVCADDVPRSRPSPMALYRCFLDLDVWPARRVVKVDDTVPGLLEGRHAGCWTVGVMASGNEVGLSLAEWSTLDAHQRDARLVRARAALELATPDYLIETVAELPAVIEAIDRLLAKGDSPRP
jgi:phosphonoacetaldehyde hydrolase